MDIDKRKFLFKAAMVGVLGTLIGTSDYSGLEGTSINVPIWFTIMIFVSHFQIILLFWLAFDNLIEVKNWIFAGFVGSLLYAALFWIFGVVISQETARVLIILKQFLIGALSAVPIWLVFKKRYSKAYLWIIANAIGYAFLELYIRNINLVTGVEVISKAINYSFLTLQIIVDSIWVIAYALLGLVLGTFLYKIIESGIVEVKVKSDV